MSETTFVVLAWCFSLVCGLTFIITIIKDRRSFVNGFLLIISILSFLTSLVLFLNSIQVLGIIGIIGLGIIFLFYSSFLWWFIPLSLYSGMKLRKLEGKKFTNSLTLLLLVSIIIFIISTNIIANYSNVRELGIISTGLSIVYLYFLIHILTFINTYFLQKLPILKKPDFIIVLGSGLVGDKVPPLLASRINKGIELYNKYKNVKEVKMIFSGGQGEDESIPEGRAMANYARDKGVPNNQIIEETESKTTYENLLYSKKKMEKLLKNYNCIVVTNNFHVLRAVLIAKKMGIKIYGVGSNTKFYFWINAFIREYIAILSMNKKRHILMLGSILLLTLLAIITSLLLRLF
ncbi:YdcF family protein [Staphylococcus succinus]|uniref:YdcF family protein n=1 Tax=Staphylococcus succinus TaxID=61015 RepID=UPI001C0412ED|nr:YdcF family protein [Staphylococcus succinus]MBU0437738.1 YdcF family protein [Staphylococcus succinus]